jgi:hypothetical protein
VSADLAARIAAALPPCETFTAPHACTDPASGRSRMSPFAADRYCLPCTVRDIIDTTPVVDVQAREREVMASVAAEILDVVHTMGAGLATKPGPLGTAGQAALDYELGARARFGTGTTNAVTAGYVLVCDEPRCHVSVTALTAEASRAAAASRGWSVAIPAAGRLTDLCPAHTSVPS